ncbi:MAG TPA: hypothetical protein VIL04_13715 [Solirubrobacterales bacterium]|jgi:uncharacterized sporulation protein YeaH/YhbH (DUF444 family)
MTTSDQPDQPQPEGQPSQEELRARLEEQLRRVRVQDLLVESAASIINLSARRIAKADERDLEQGRIGIEAVRRLLELIEGEVADQIRSALSELQLLYAREARGGGGEGGSGEGGGAGGSGSSGEGPSQPPPSSRGGGPASGLWVPGRD